MKERWKTIRDVNKYVKWSQDTEDTKIKDENTITQNSEESISSIDMEDHSNLLQIPSKSPSKFNQSLAEQSALIS